MKAIAQLPFVGPEFLVIERRPEQLHAYARGLQQHLRQIRDGEKARRYPITTIKAAAVWLIKSYAAAGDCAPTGSSPAHRRDRATQGRCKYVACSALK